MKAKYNSIYSPNKKITCFQLILEIVCENKAKTQDKELVIKFWDDENWNKFYKTQLRICSKLCAEFTEEKVLKFVWEKKIYSLFAKWIPEALEQFKYMSAKTDIEVIVNRNTTESTGTKKQNNKVKKIMDLLDG